MSWFHVSPAGQNVPEPPEGMTAESEKKWRISLLDEEERQAFEWFRLGYTPRWTAETMLLDRRSAAKLFRSVFCKLNVSDETEILRLYLKMVMEPREFYEEGGDQHDK